MLSRRNFMLGSVGAVSALAGGCRMFEGAAVTGTDPDFSVFISDIHCSGENIKTQWGAQPTRQNKLLAETVDEILALRPRPAIWETIRREHTGRTVTFDYN